MCSNVFHTSVFQLSDSLSVAIRIPAMSGAEIPESLKAAVDAVRPPDAVVRQVQDIIDSCEANGEQVTGWERIEKILRSHDLMRFAQVPPQDVGVAKINRSMTGVRGLRKPILVGRDSSGGLVVEQIQFRHSSRITASSFPHGGAQQQHIASPIVRWFNSGASFLGIDQPGRRPHQHCVAPGCW